MDAFTKYSYEIPRIKLRYSNRPNSITKTISDAIK